MTDGFSLEEYALGPTVAAAPIKIVPQRKLWSRQVAADLVGCAEAVALVLGGLLPPALYAASGAIEPNWPVALQSALVAALLFRLFLISAGMYAPIRGNSFAVKPLRMLGAIVLSVLVSLSLGAPKDIGLVNAAIWLALWSAASYSAAILVRTIASDLMASATAAGRFDERVAVYGAGHIARRVHDHLLNPALGLRFVGVIAARHPTGSMPRG